jgi:Ethanolamine utilization protein EutJ (predicted chaperonin)
MNQAFSIEVGGRSAGIAIAERGGFVFFAADRAFHALEGQVFRRLRHAERAAERLLFAPAEASFRA